MKDLHDVIIKPVLSEKSYDQMNYKKYTFIVDPDANRTEVKQAVEAVFDVKVARVNIINRDGKLKRQGYTQGRRAATKRAVVTLTEDSKGIPFFENMH